MSNPQTFVDILDGHAREIPDHVAFRFLGDGDRETASLTYGELRSRALRIAGGLRAIMPRGHTVALAFPPGLDGVEALFGCLYAGVVPVSIAPHRLRPGSRQPLIRHSGARWVLGTRLLLDRHLARGERLEGVELTTIDALRDHQAVEPSPLPPEQTALIQYSSGSISSPKGVELSHANLLHNSESIRAAMRHSASLVGVGILPTYHDMGLIGSVLQPVYCGGQCILLPPLRVLQKPLRWLRAISTYRATSSGGPNYAYRLCAERGVDVPLASLDLSCWDVAYIGAEPVQREVLRQFNAAFEKHGFRESALFPCYGLAESTLMVTGGHYVPEPRGSAHVSCGPPGPGLQVRIVDPKSGQPCPAGEIGEIWVSGRSVARGYRGSPEMTASAFRAKLEMEPDRRYLRTGDLGYFQADELVVTGRLKNVLIVRGRNIQAEDLEQAIGRCHAGLNPGACSAIECREGVVVVAECRRAARGRIDSAAVLREIRQTAMAEFGLGLQEVVLLRPRALPRTSSGKLNRSQIASEWGKSRFEDTAIWSSTRAALEVLDVE